MSGFDWETFMRSLVLSLALLIATGCGGSTGQAGGTPAKTSLNPPAGPFNGEVTVTFTTDKPADLFISTDGSDPRTSPTRVNSASPATITLKQTTAVTYFSRTPEGLEEELHTAQYVRAGGPKGTVSGVVVLGNPTAGHAVSIVSDGNATPLGPGVAKTELPFFIKDLTSGAHRLQAAADLNDDGKIDPLRDLASDAFSYELDLNDPAKASLEGVKLYLGASKPGLCTIEGEVILGKPIPRQALTVTTLDPAVLRSGNVDAQQLLSQLSNGYRTFTNDTDTHYPFQLRDLDPGTYLAVPALTGLGASASINLVADLTSIIFCSANGIANSTLRYGQVELSGTATWIPASPPSGFVYGMIAARKPLSLLSQSLQVVLMPTFFVQAGTDYKASFGGEGLKDNGAFQLRAFTNAGGADPFTAGLTWALNPMAPEPAQATFTATPPSVQQDFTAQ